MKKVFFIFAMGCLLAMPCFLRAEEVVITLSEVVGLTPLPGDNPLDDANQTPIDPTRPGDFMATINGNALSVTILNEDIPSAQAIVVNVATSNIVVNEQFTESLEEQIPSAGVYVLNIQTANGALTGQFLVQ